MDIERYTDITTELLHEDDDDDDDNDDGDDGLHEQATDI